MESISIRKASDLSQSARSAIEEIVGRPIASDEEIRVVATRPPSPPSPEHRVALAASLEAFLNRRAEKVHDVPDTELDAAIDEAVRMARRGG